MSVASRIFSVLRSQARFSSRTVFERLRDGQGGRGRHQARGDDADTPRNEGHQAGGEAPRGRPRDPDLATYYANLEIPYGSHLEDIETAWKRLARRYHPDRHASDPERQAVATELLQGINHAYTEIRRHLESAKRP